MVVFSGQHAIELNVMRNTTVWHNEPPGLNRDRDGGEPPLEAAYMETHTGDVVQNPASDTDAQADRHAKQDSFTTGEESTNETKSLIADGPNVGETGESYKLTGTELDQHLQVHSKKLVEHTKKERMKRRLYFAGFCPLPLALMCPVFRAITDDPFNPGHTQPFFAGQGAYGVIIVCISVLCTYTIFATYFLQLANTAVKFGQVKWQLKVFSALLSKGNSAFTYNGVFVEVPSIDLSTTQNLLYWMDMRAYYQV
jgi:hypothetical protein